MFECPEGCNSKNIKTLRGWKRHMTQYHGAWTPEQVAEVLRKATLADGVTAMPYADINDAVEKAPEVEPTTQTSGPERTQARSRRPKLAIEMQHDLVNMIGKFGDALALTTDFFIFKLVGNHCTEDEKKILKEGWEAPLKVLNIVFNIQTLDVNLTSTLWVFLFPIMAILTVFGSVAGSKLPDLISSALEKDKKNERVTKDE